MEDLDSGRKRENKRRLLFYVKFFVSVGLLVLILRAANLSEIWHALQDADFRMIVAAAALNPVGGFLIALRWQGLLRSQGVNAPLVRLVQSCIAANFFRQLLPSTIGGDTIRGYDSWKLGASKTVAVSSLVVDRLFGLVILLFFAAFGIALSPRIIPEVRLLPLWIGLAALGVSALVALLFRPESRTSPIYTWVGWLIPARARNMLDQVSASLAAFRGRSRLMATSLLLSLGLQVNVILFYVLIGTALGLPVPFLAYLVVIPIATVVMMIPISINAIGLREGVFVVLLGVFGVGTSQAVAFAWLEYGLFLLYGVIGGVVHALRKH